MLNLIGICLVILSFALFIAVLEWEGRQPVHRSREPYEETLVPDERLSKAQAYIKSRNNICKI